MVPSTLSMSFSFWCQKGFEGMQVLGPQGTPIYTGYVAAIGSRQQDSFGSKPFAGLKGGCGCSPVNGCGCADNGGLRGFGATSLDQIISGAFDWLSGTAQAALPDSAAVPPQYGSTGAIATQITQLLPYAIGAYLLYKLVKK